MSPRNILKIVLQPAHLRRTGLVALLVGTWLTLFNHGTELLVWPWSTALVWKIAMNLLTPFVVSNLGLISRQVKSDTDVAT